MPEIVDVGLTGLLPESVDEAVDALDDALRLDRAKVRQQAVERFSADRMVADYLRVYDQIVGFSGQLR
jgi:hypothetical protein